MDTPRFRAIRNVIVIGFDGLEKELVEEWNLGNILQDEHGISQVPPHPVSQEYITPVIWMSFITGQTPEEHKTYNFEVYRNTVLRWFQVFVESHQTMNNIFNVFRPGRFLKKLGFRKGAYLKGSKRTIFSEVENSYGISIPVYDEEMPMEFISKSWDKVQLWNYFDSEKKKFFEELNDYKLFMYHFWSPDFFGHMFSNEIQEIRKVYQECDLLVRKVSEKSNKNTWILVISDHGTLGTHSNYGFWSSNIKLGIKYPKIIDFYTMILSACKTGKIKPPKVDGKKFVLKKPKPIENREKVEQRLKALGYF